MLRPSTINGYKLTQVIRASDDFSLASRSRNVYSYTSEGVHYIQTSLIGNRIKQQQQQQQHLSPMQYSSLVALLPESMEAALIASTVSTGVEVKQ